MKFKKMTFQCSERIWLVISKVRGKQTAFFQGLESGSFPLHLRVFAVKKMVTEPCLTGQIFHNAVLACSLVN